MVFELYNYSCCGRGMCIAVMFVIIEQIITKYFRIFKDCVCVCVCVRLKFDLLN